MLRNSGFVFLAMTQLQIWPHKPRRLVYRHVIYFYKLSFSWESKMKKEKPLCQHSHGPLEEGSTAK